jgi:uncharacterized protein
MNIGPIIFIVAFAVISTFLNWYVFHGVKTLVNDLSPNIRNITSFLYWLVFGGITTLAVATFIKIIADGKIHPAAYNLINILLTVMVTQLVFLIFLIGEDLIRSLVAGGRYLSSSEGDHLPSRRKFVTQLGLVVAAIPFTSIVYGIFKGKYNFKVHRQSIYFEDLPEDFDGFKIVQLSDIHAGSFKDFAAVQRGIDLAIAQKPDLFVFTGDLVNHRADEIEPFVDRFKDIKANYGQFSILGNHDYGDYVPWDSQQAKKENFEKLKSLHAQMGYQLLMNENVTIQKGDSTIKLVGVENWGVGFNQKGDLEKALHGANGDDFKVLLSHDPSHWEQEVSHHTNKIQLTLSGHTHGMQFGIETPVIRWSPAQYRYPHWAGLTGAMGRYLYVNRGFGFHAFSGRVGIWPEVTVLELKKQRL